MEKQAEMEFSAWDLVRKEMTNHAANAKSALLARHLIGMKKEQGLKKVCIDRRKNDGDRI